MIRNIKKILLTFLNKVQNKINPKSQLEILKERGLKFGDNFKMYDSYIDYSHCFLVEIGNDVTMTHSTILAHDASTKYYIGKSKVGKVIVGNRVFIGWGSLILPNVKIGDDVIIGAGSVVTKNIPNNCIVAGNPAKVIGNTFDYRNNHKKNLESKPVFDNYWREKTQFEILEMQGALSSTYGYDE